MINGRTRLHVVANGTMTSQRYIDEVLLPRVCLFRGAVGDKFVFMDDNATCHRTLAVQYCLDSEDALGRQVAGRNYPPTNKNTLIRALTEEWDKLPQQLLDNVVQSMLLTTVDGFRYTKAQPKPEITHPNCERSLSSSTKCVYLLPPRASDSRSEGLGSMPVPPNTLRVHTGLNGQGDLHRNRPELKETRQDLIRVVENLDGTVESTDTIVKLKTKIENSSTFESDPEFVKTLIQNCIDERVSQNEREVTLEKQKIELAKLQLAKLEKEIELQTAKNKALSLNPAAKVEDKQFETNIENMIKKEELNDYEKLKSIVLREFQLTPRECLNSFKNAVKSSGETYIQFAARLTANFQYYCSLRKVNSFESLCDLIISDKLFETLNKETATHIGIREAEDWFRPIDLAKECDIYISSRSGSHKETPITYGYTQDPFKNRSQNFKPKIKENYPQYLERENKNCFICGDSSHCARDCEKRFKPKESNSHIHNKINVNTLKIESEKQNSDEFANLQYVNIFVENQPVTALIDSGCQIPVLNSSLIRVQTPSEEIITLSSCFGEQRMVEVKPINLSLNQHSPEKLGHAKSDVLLSESESSLSADYGVSFPNVSVSNVIENSSYDLPYVKNFNTRNDSSSLIKDYKCNKIKSTKLKLSIVREKCSDIVLCKKVNGAMKTSSVEFISRSPNPLPMKSEHRRFVLLRKIFQPWQWKRRKKRNRFEQTSRTLQRKISMRSTKDQLVKKDVLMPVKQCFPVEPSGCRRGAFT
ncbi:retrovirus-related Pol polyprotein from transposon opus [Trichonephila clavipes]|nr:retrovirus-related Pol polyprotein from transposon opus [Trichonephila clavipes]